MGRHEARQLPILGDRMSIHLDALEAKTADKLSLAHHEKAKFMNEACHEIDRKSQVRTSAEHTSKHNRVI
jgi:hypothetical protein